MALDALIESLDVKVYRVLTEQPESDGTYEWDHTDVVCLSLTAGGQTGLGWTYAAKAAGAFIEANLKKIVMGRRAMDVEALWQAMIDAVRNDGRDGLAARAISAVDVAAWDLKARLLNLPLVDLIGSVRREVPIYGSGGFTNYTHKQLSDQLSGWLAEGIHRVKMKIGRDGVADVQRVNVARKAIGEAAELFVDANGAYSRKQALRLAEQFSADADVRWFEEPVSSDDLSGLRLLRDRAPAGMDIAAGEYAQNSDEFRGLLTAGTVDCLQADATRCGGISGFLKAACLSDAFHIPFSAHCAPQLHAHVGCCVRSVRHIEYFHDHVRLAPLLFDGVLLPKNGCLAPDRSRIGHGLTIKATADAFSV